jgi:hypothetical protein
MPLIAGLVIRIPDPNVRPKNKLKLHICVCPLKRLFLRINSNPMWEPWHELLAAQNDFLDHDSYVELLELHVFPQAEIDKAEVIGEMNIAEMDALAKTAMGCVTLTGEQREIIDENLASPF